MSLSLTADDLYAIASRPWTPVEEGCSDLQVMKSAAGYYVGRHKIVDGCPMPYSRESGYFGTAAKAQEALALLQKWEKEGEYE